MRNNSARAFILPLVCGIAVLLAGAQSSQAATLAADYQLQNTFGSSVGLIGPLTTVDTASDISFMPGTVFGQPQQVLNFAGVGNDHGVQSQTAGFISSSNYSIVLLASFTFNMTDAIATKVFDFKNLSSDAGLYVNSASGLLSFNGIMPTPPIGGTPVVTGTYTQIVLTRDGITGLTTVYQDGQVAFSFTDTNGDAILADATATGNAFLTVFDDDNANPVGVTNESSVGNVARLRLFDGVLTAAEVMALDTTASIPEPSTWALGFAGAVMLALFVRRRRLA